MPWFDTFLVEFIEFLYTSFFQQPLIWKSYGGVMLFKLAFDLIYLIGVTYFFKDLIISMAFKVVKPVVSGEKPNADATFIALGSAGIILYAWLISFFGLI